MSKIIINDGNISSSNNISIIPNINITGSIHLTGSSPYSGAFIGLNTNDNKGALHVVYKNTQDWFGAGSFYRFVDDNNFVGNKYGLGLFSYSEISASTGTQSLEIMSLYSQVMNKAYGNLTWGKASKLMGHLIVISTSTVATNSVYTAIGSQVKVSSETGAVYDHWKNLYGYLFNFHPYGAGNLFISGGAAFKSDTVNNLSYITLSSSFYHFYATGSNPSYFGGNVGINTKKPTAYLQIGPGNFSSSDTLLIAASKSISSDNGEYGNTGMDLEINISNPVGNNIDQRFYGITSHISTTSDQTGSLTGGDIYGTTINCLEGGLYHLGTGIIPSVTGIHGFLELSGLGIINSASGLFSHIVLNAASGTIDNVYGLLISNDKLNLSTGTINNSYGIYINQLSGSNLNYAIYSKTNSPSYFSGSIYTNNNLYISNSNDIGILEIKGAGNVYQHTSINFRSTGSDSWYCTYRKSGMLWFGYTSDNITYYNSFKIEPKTPTNTLYLQSGSGNVGIDNDNPIEKLDINGNLLVNGFIQNLNTGSLLAKWYNDTNQKGTFNGKHFYQSIESNIEWTDKNPNGQSDSFSLRLVGYIKPDYSQTYTFYMTSDDGQRLWVNNTNLIDNWIDQGSTIKSSSISLIANTWYPIVAEHYEYTGTEYFKLEWESVSQSREVLGDTPSRLAFSGKENSPSQFATGYFTRTVNLAATTGSVLIGYDTDPGINNKLALNGNSFFNGNIIQNGSTSIYNNFISGWTGTGWKINQNISSSLELDDLTVRGILRVYELLIQQIRATNGSVFITAAAKVSSSRNDGTYDIIECEDPSGDGYTPFAQNDIIMTQRVQVSSSTITKRIVRKVSDVNGLFISCSLLGDGPGDTSIIETGDDFVRIGNTINTNRQGSVYLTSDDSDSPFIDIINGVSSWTDWTNKLKLKVRLGNLSGITTDNFGILSNYGLYAKGGIYLESSGSSNSIALKVDSGSAQLTMKQSGNSIFDFDTETATANIADWTINPDYLRRTYGDYVLTLGNTIGGTDNRGFEIRNTSTSHTLKMTIYSGSDQMLFRHYVDANNNINIGDDPNSVLGSPGLRIRASGNDIVTIDTSSAVFFGWNVDAEKLYNGTDVVLDAINKKISVYNDSVKMYYTNASNYGISSSTFQLGSKNTIASWNFNNNSLYSTNIALHSNNFSEGAEILLGNNTSSYSNASIGLKGDGSGKFANGELEWDSNGDFVTSSRLPEYTRLFGNGDDGTVTISSNTTLTRDMYYNNLTINTGKILYTNGYRIFVKNKLIISGTIDNSGESGTDRTQTAGGAGGTLAPGGGGGAGGLGYGT